MEALTIIYIAAPVIAFAIWYYKTNQQIKLLEEQKKSLEQIAFSLSGKLRVKIDEKENL